MSGAAARPKTRTLAPVVCSSNHQAQSNYHQRRMHVQYSVENACDWISVKHFQHWLAKRHQQRELSATPSRRSYTPSCGSRRTTPFSPRLGSESEIDPVESNTQSRARSNSIPKGKTFELSGLLSYRYIDDYPSIHGLQTFFKSSITTVGMKTYSNQHLELRPPHLPIPSKIIPAVNAGVKARNLVALPRLLSCLRIRVRMKHLHLLARRLQSYRRPE